MSNKITITTKLTLTINNKGNVNTNDNTNDNNTNTRNKSIDNNNNTNDNNGINTNTNNNRVNNTECADSCWFQLHVLAILHARKFFASDFVLGLECDFEIPKSHLRPEHFRFPCMRF